MIRRRAASLVLAAACLTGVAGAVLTTTPAAQAATATAYRYWTYWYGNGASWELGRTGPPNALKDGQVIGWRFSISPDSRSSEPPRATADFDAICGGTPAASGTYRVAVVVDYGLAADAPSGEKPPRSTPASYCAVLGAQHNGYFATQSNGHTIRVNSSGLVCGIDGYPKTECGDAVSAPVATKTPAPSTKASVAPTKQPTTTAGSTAPATPVAPPSGAAPSTSTSSGTTSASPSTPTSPTPGPSESIPSSAEARPVPPGDAAPVSGSGGNGLPVGLITGGVLVAALATAATLRARRR